MLAWPIFDAARASRRKRSTRSALVMEAGVQHLDRHAAPDVDVVPLVHAAHGAFAAQPAHVVAARRAWTPIRGSSPGARSRAVGGGACGWGSEMVAAWAGAAAPGAGTATAPDSSALAPAISAWRSRRSSEISFAYSGSRNSTSARGVGLGRGLREEAGQIGAHRFAVGITILALGGERPHARCGRARAARARSASTALVPAARARAGARPN